jgi:hypothetical protein
MSTKWANDKKNKTRPKAGDVAWKGSIQHNYKVKSELSTDKKDYALTLIDLIV